MTTTLSERPGVLVTTLGVPVRRRRSNSRRSLVESGRDEPVGRVVLPPSPFCEIERSRHASRRVHASAAPVYACVSRAFSKRIRPACTILPPRQKNADVESVIHGFPVLLSLSLGLARRRSVNQPSASRAPLELRNGRPHGRTARSLGGLAVGRSAPGRPRRRSGRGDARTQGRVWACRPSVQRPSTRWCSSRRRRRHRLPRLPRLRLRLRRPACRPPCRSYAKSQAPPAR